MKYADALCWRGREIFREEVKIYTEDSGTADWKSTLWKNQSLKAVVRGREEVKICTERSGATDWNTLWKSLRSVVKEVEAGLKYAQKTLVRPGPRRA